MACRIAFMGILLCAQTIAAQVRLTEIMFNPIGPESTDEFIEIYNASRRDTVDLHGWKIGDQDAVETILFPDSIAVLLPGQYALVLDPDYFADSNSYDDLIPADALLLTVETKTLGSGGLSNSHPETILLLDADGDTAATYTYSPDNPPGFSDEKIDPAGDDSPENWANSRTLNGTPGKRNSVSPRDFNLQLQLSSEMPHRLRTGDSLFVKLRVQNIGLRRFPPTWLRIFDAGTELFSHFIPELPPAARFEIGWGGKAEPPGRHWLKFEVDTTADEAPEDNRIERELEVGWPVSALLINEIMFQPLPGDPEWIEVFNPGDAAVPLSGWQVRDASGKTGVLPATAPGVEPHHFAVIAARGELPAAYAVPDSVPVVAAAGFPALNRNAETVLLLDPFGFSVDSVAYAPPSWPGSGVSLERKREDRSSTDPENFGPSAAPEGATPGRRNSISPWEKDLAVRSADITIEPAFPRRGEAAVLQVTVRNPGRLPVADARLVFGVDADGDSLLEETEIVQVLEPLPQIAAESFRRVEVEWIPPRSGWFALLFRVDVDGDGRPQDNLARISAFVRFEPGDLVVNEIMAAPREGEPEWVEIINLSQQPVMLQGWRLADSRSVSAEISHQQSIPPEGFLVLAQDSLPGVAAELQVMVEQWPSLNNDADELVLIDAAGVSIDSVAYRMAADWPRGTSLERINPQLPSTQQDNWRACTAPDGATPAQPNSIYTPAAPFASELQVSPNPFSPDGDGFEDFALIRFRLPWTYGRAHLSLFDLRGRKVRQLLNNSTTGSERTVVWDGRDEEGHKLPVGIYVIYLEAVSEDGRKTVQRHCTVVLAKKLGR